MDITTTERYQKLSNYSRPSQQTRYEMAILQSKMFDQLNCKNPEVYKDKIKTLISQWIEENQSAVYQSKTILIDLQEFYSKIQGGAQQKSSIDELLEPMQNIRRYLWVSHRADGMVITVGRTTRSVDDLFKKLSMPTGTAPLVLWTYADNNEQFVQYNNFLANYLKWGWVIPIENGVDSINSLEKDLGDYLINNNVPILDYYSHRH